MATAAKLWYSPTVTGFRRLMYAVTPNETSFATMAEVPDYTSEVIPYFVICVILEGIVCAATNRRVPRINDGITSMSAGLFSQLPVSLIRSIELTAYNWIHENLRVVALPWDSVWTWWICFFFTDMGYYWFHRMAHEVNIFWASHQVHHSSEDYNLTTALRQSILQRYISWVFYLPLAFAIPTQIFMVHFQFNILYQFWIHTEAVRSLGPLEYILNTPSHHRVHHGRNRYCIDKNYAGTLIIWDRLFGTFAQEDEEVVYGLTHPLKTWSLFHIQFCHLKYMWRRIWRFKTLGHKMSFIWKGPGWKPGTSRAGNIEDIPDVKAPQPVYDKKDSLAVSLYVLSHFIIILVGYTVFLSKRKGMSALTVVTILGYLIFCLHSFGSINDKRWFAPYLEVVRCLIFLGVDWLLIVNQSGLMLVVRAIFALSAFMWSLQCIQASGLVKVKKTD